MSKYYVSCFDINSRELNHHEVNRSVFIYVKQLEKAIRRNNFDNMMALYPYRFNKEYYDGRY